MRLAIRLLLLLVLPFAARAQTTVSATVVDPNSVPYRNGTVTAYIPSDSNTPAQGPVPTDNSGAFSFTIPSQDWWFKVCTPAIVAVPPNPVPYGTVCFSTGPITITGGTQSITTQLNAAAVKIDPNGGTGGGGTVTNTAGALTAGHLVIGNGGDDETIDSVLSTDGNGTLSNDGSSCAGNILLGFNSGQQANIGCNGSIAAFSVVDNDSGSQVSADPTNGLVVDGTNLNLSGVAVAPPDVIDAAASPGIGGQVFTSLGGSHAGTQWSDPHTISAFACGSATDCGSATANFVSTMAYGTVALTAGTATVTDLLFASATSYVCTITDTTGTLNILKVVQTDGQNITITGSVSNTDHVNYICIGI